MYSHVPNRLLQSSAEVVAQNTWNGDSPPASAAGEITGRNDLVSSSSSLPRASGPARCFLLSLAVGGVREYTMQRRGTGQGGRHRRKRDAGHAYKSSRCGEDVLARGRVGVLWLWLRFWISPPRTTTLHHHAPPRERVLASAFSPSLSKCRRNMTGEARGVCG